MLTISKVRALFWVFIIYFVSVVSFQSLGMEGQTLNRFLREGLVGIDRKDPPIFQLITNGGRQIYIVASSHNRDPEFLLPHIAYEFLHDIAPRAVLFTEHASLNPHLKSQLEVLKILPESPDLWQLSDLTFNEKQSFNWEAVKSEEFYPGGPKIEQITKMRFDLGALSCYSFASVKYRERVTPAFETTLLTWRWHQKDLALEELDLAIRELTENPKDIITFCNGGLSQYAKIKEFERNLELDKLVAWTTVLNQYKESIAKYSYEECLLNYILVKHSTRERNKIWIKTIMAYLQEKGSTDKQPPIVIVCGLNHLKGGLIKGCQSFLELLEELQIIESIKRMRIDGEWESLK